MPTLLQFGAGNIGRSFIAELFAAAGYEVTFVDVNAELVAQLNAQRRYRVRILDEARSTDCWVEGVRAVNGRDRDTVTACLVEADIAACAVGSGALQYLYAGISQGLQARYAKYGLRPLDLILAENLRQAAGIVREGVRAHLPADFPLDDMLGLIETSIGKMVPLQTEAMRRADPLMVCAEAYRTLILDATAFRNPIPDVPGIFATPHIAAYVDRKLFVHNLGHAAVAYLGFRHDPSLVTIADALTIPSVRAGAEAAMRESTLALVRAYPDAFTLDALHDHVADLLRRFGNRALGDTVYRVGRDLRRKLSLQDRIIGALLLDQTHGVPAPATTAVAAAALGFRATDEDGNPFPADRDLWDQLAAHGVEATLPALTVLNPDQPEQAAILADILSACGQSQNRLKSDVIG